MSFISDFKTIIEGNASINALVTGGIKFSHLPEDWDVKKNWMVWDYRITDQVNTLGYNNVYINYSILITITATDTIVLNTISDYVRNYLNAKTTTNFVDLNFISDSKITTLSKVVNTYQNTLEFSAIYVS